MHPFDTESPAAKGRSPRPLLILSVLARRSLALGPGECRSRYRQHLGQRLQPGIRHPARRHAQRAQEPDSHECRPRGTADGTATVAGAEAPDFLIVHDSCSGETISPGSTCQVTVRFAPSATGARSATLEVPSNDPSSPLEVALSGQGGALPEGPEGPKGEEGSEGPAGPRGRTGAEGSEGSEGPRGARGAQGPPGPPAVNGTSLLLAHPGREIKLVACNARGRACKVSWLAGTARFATLATLHLKLVHFGAVYGSGGPDRRGAVLRVRRHMGPGRYKLILTFHSGQMLITVRRQLIIR